jgi:hypothetical protein
MEDLVCKGCGLIQTIEESNLSYQPSANGKGHIRAECYSCNTWIRWLPQNSLTLSLVTSVRDSKTGKGKEKPPNNTEVGVGSLGVDSDLEFDYETSVESNSYRNEEECVLDL